MPNFPLNKGVLVCFISMLICWPGPSFAGEQAELNRSEAAIAGPSGGIWKPGKQHKLQLKGKRKKVREPAAKAENQKLTAILLTIALGPFGAHRLYLGTDFKVPIVYTLTLGGGLGILPAIDLIILLLNKDISPYQHNTKVFMWG